MAQAEKDLEKLEQKNKFYRSQVPKNKIKPDEEKEEKELSIAICWGGVCIPVDMSWDEAGEWCNIANKLLATEDPKDRAKVEQAWELLQQGKAVEGMQLMQAKEPQMVSTADKTREWRARLKKESDSHSNEPSNAQATQPGSSTAPTPLSTTPKPKLY